MIHRVYMAIYNLCIHFVSGNTILKKNLTKLPKNNNLCSISHFIGPTYA